MVREAWPSGNACVRRICTLRAAAAAGQRGAPTRCRRPYARAAAAAKARARGGKFPPAAGTSTPARHAAAARVPGRGANCILGTGASAAQIWAGGRAEAGWLRVLSSHVDALRAVLLSPPVLEPWGDRNGSLFSARRGLGGGRGGAGDRSASPGRARQRFVRPPFLTGQPPPARAGSRSVRTRRRGVMRAARMRSAIRARASSRLRAWLRVAWLVITSRPSASSRLAQSLSSRERAASVRPSTAARSTRRSILVATLFTFWPPGPEARTAWTVSADGGTRTASVTIIASLMPSL